MEYETQKTSRRFRKPSQSTSESWTGASSIHLRDGTWTKNEFTSFIIWPKCDGIAITAALISLPIEGLRERTEYVPQLEL